MSCIKTIHINNTKCHKDCWYYEFEDADKIIRKFAALYNAETKVWSIICNDNGGKNWCVYIPDLGRGGEETANTIVNALSVEGRTITASEREFWERQIGPHEDRVIPPIPCPVCGLVWEHKVYCELN